MTFLVDSHCHLASLKYEGKGAQNIHEAIKRASLCGVTHFLSIACTNEDFSANAQIASQFDNIYLSCGVHPLNLDEDPNWSEEELVKNLLSSDKVIALGETGLDFHYAPLPTNIFGMTYFREADVDVHDSETGQVFPQHLVPEKPEQK